MAIFGKKKKGSFIDKDTFYYLNISFDQGGFLHNSKLIVRVNQEPVEFFGKKFRIIPPFSSTTMAIINDQLVQGNNHLKIEIEKLAGVEVTAENEPCKFSLNIQKKQEGEIVDSKDTGSSLMNLDMEIHENQFNEAGVFEGNFDI